MIFLDEDDARRLVHLSDAMQAVRDVFISMARGMSRNFPVVREKVPEFGGTFGVKSGIYVDKGIVGLKAGGYWPANSLRGIKNHQSTTLLCDADSGRPIGLVAANYLTALRTAAAAALATDALARRSVETLGVIGAGAQALPQIEAQAAVRPFRRVLVASRDPARAQEVSAAARSFVSEAEAADFRIATEEADVLLTLTPAVIPVVQSSWVRAGTHINAMGADTAGKAELEPQLLVRARICFDEWEQAMSIGECQRAVAMGLLSRESTIGSLGEVLSGAKDGRQSEDDVTLFDSTGVALQDIAIATLALDRARNEHPAV